jgi:hypothetical protein
MKVVKQRKVRSVAEIFSAVCTQKVSLGFRVQGRVWMHVMWPVECTQQVRRQGESVYACDVACGFEVSHRLSLNGNDAIMMPL